MLKYYDNMSGKTRFANGIVKELRTFVCFKL